MTEATQTEHPIPTTDTGRLLSRTAELATECERLRTQLKEGLDLGEEQKALARREAELNRREKLAQADAQDLAQKKDEFFARVKTDEQEYGKALHAQEEYDRMRKQRDSALAFKEAGIWVFLLVLLLFAAYCWQAGFHLAVDERDALVSASRAVGFPVGHASAQLGWRGLRSRPTWRILLYSAEEPPRTRGLVLVDGVDGDVLEHFTEDNPEDWTEL